MQVSIVIRKIIYIVFICSFYLSFSQNDGRKLVTIYIDNLKHKALEGYSISKDTTSAHFSIYMKGFEIMRNRERAIKEYYKGPETSLGEPTFVFTFTAFLFKPVVKPERIKSLNGITYITVKEFRNRNYPESSPTYIIHKLKDGSYLRWKTMFIPLE